MFALNAFVSLAMVAAELATGSPDNQTSDRPSMALLLYLDEFPSQDDDMVDIALICTNEVVQQSEQDAGLHALVQCETLASDSQSSAVIKTSSSEKTPHD